MKITQNNYQELLDKVIENPRLLNKVENPNEEFCLDILKQNPWHWQFLPQQFRNRDFLNKYKYEEKYNVYAGSYVKKRDNNI